MLLSLRTSPSNANHLLSPLHPSAPPLPADSSSARLSNPCLDPDADASTQPIFATSQAAAPSSQVHELEASFTRFRAEARNMLSPAEAEEQEEDHLVRVSDLVNALGVSEREAEEMMFIADMNEDQTVGFTEFKQVVVNWS
eukprot:6173852-Pleurochrysis_carterae.AAC.1